MSGWRSQNDAGGQHNAPQASVHGARRPDRPRPLDRLQRPAHSAASAACGWDGCEQPVQPGGRGHCLQHAVAAHYRRLGQRQATRQSPRAVNDDRTLSSSGSEGAQHQPSSAAPPQVPPAQPWPPATRPRPQGGRQRSDGFSWQNATTQSSPLPSEPEADQHVSALAASRRDRGVGRGALFGHAARGVARASSVEAVDDGEQRSLSASAGLRRTRSSANEGGGGGGTFVLRGVTYADATHDRNRVGLDGVPVRWDADSRDDNISKHGCFPGCLLFGFLVMVGSRSGGILFDPCPCTDARVLF